MPQAAANKSRVAEFDACRKIDPEFHAALPLLIAAAANAKARYGTAETALLWIGYIGPQARSAVPALLDMLKKDPRRAAEIATTIGDIGPDAAAATGALLDLLNASDRKSGDRNELMTALTCIAPKAPQVFAALVQQLHGPDEQQRQGAIAALSAMAPEAGDPVPVIMEALERENDDDGRNSLTGAALKSLGDLGPRARAAAPELRRRLAGKSSYRRCDVALALWKITGEIEPSLSTLVAAADDMMDAGYVAPSIRQFGSAAVPRLSTILSDSATPAAGRRAILAALGEMGAAAEPALPATIAALADTDDRVRIGAAAALGKLGPLAHDAIPALVKAVRTWSPEKTVAFGFSTRNDALDAADALSRIDPQAAAAAALDLLIAQLGKDAHRHGVEQAIAILIRIGPSAHRALPALKALREELGNQIFQIRTHMGLSALGRPDPPEITQRESLRAAAAAAIEQIGKSAEAP